MTERKPFCDSILVIEDDDAIRDAIRHLLEMEGYNVVTAPDGKSGIETIRSMGRPCLILLDLMLPVMDGWEFLGVLRKEPGVMIAAIPVVITSAAGDAAYTAVKQAQGFIKKPIDFDLLLNAVQKFCGIREQSDLKSA